MTGLGRGASAGGALDGITLADFLGCCRGDWGPRDLRAVQRKLVGVGVSKVDDLLKLVHDGILNERLEAAGERRFTTETLDAMRATGVLLAVAPRSAHVGHAPSLGTPDLISDAEFEDFLSGLPSPTTVPSRLPAPAPGGGDAKGRSLAAKPRPITGGAVGGGGGSGLGGLCGGYPGSHLGQLFDPDGCSDESDEDGGGGGGSGELDGAGGSEGGWGSANGGLGRGASSRQTSLGGAAGARSAVPRAVGRAGSRWAGQQASCCPDTEDPVTLRRQICHGLSRIEKAAAEAKRRNHEVTRCLVEVQADIARITEKMVSARQRRTGTQRSSKYDSATCIEVPPHSSNANMAAAAQAAARVRSCSGRAAPPRTPPGPQGAWDFSSGPASGESGPGKRLRSSLLRDGRQQGPFASAGAHAAASSSASWRSCPATREKEGVPPCPRAAQSGFAFGGCGASAPEPPPRETRPPLPGSATGGTDEGAGTIAEAAARVHEAVRAELLAVRSHSEDERRAFVKRLLVRWHPDRNPESSEVATSVFQYIQQEKGRLLGL